MRESGAKEVLIGRRGEPNITELKEIVTNVKIGAEFQEPRSKGHESNRHD